MGLFRGALPPLVSIVLAGGCPAAKMPPTTRPAPAVRATITTLTLPTYAVGPDDPNPPLLRRRVYPYPMQIDLKGDKQPRRYRAVVLENRHIRVVILPALGGKIYAAHHKADGGADFIYHNHVVKPGLVAMRGAWTSGGVEWNFPSFGHSVNTFEPVPYTLQNKRDGSVSCVVGVTELVSRMRWTVTITLRPRSTVIEHSARLENRTLAAHRAYFWANAAVHSHADTRIHFPATTDHVYPSHLRDSTWRWPVHEGRDLSWVRSTAEPFEYYSARPAAFIAAYHTKQDRGTVHVTPANVPGKKFWTWGTAREGRIWDDLLTDKDGSYVELQSGRTLTQGGTWMLGPHEVVTLKGGWYPVRGIGGVVAATRLAALNVRLRPDGDHARIGLFVTQPVVRGRLVLRVSTNADRIWERPVTLDTGGILLQRVSLRGRRGPLSLTLHNREGRELVRYDGSVRSLPSPPLAAKDSARARAAYEAWDLPRALRLLEDAAKSEKTPARSLFMLARIEIERGCLSRAEALLTRVLTREPKRAEARYYRALARFYRGASPTEVEGELRPLIKGGPVAPQASYLAALCAARKKRWKRAERLLQRFRFGALRPRLMLAALARRAGERERSRRLVGEVLQEDPLSPLAHHEHRLLGGTVEGHANTRGLQARLELAADYIEFGLDDEAEQVLKTAPEGPLPLYWRGWLRLRRGDRARAKQLFARAAEKPVEGVFPFRVETESALRSALELMPDQWQAHHYLGTMLAPKLRWRGSLKHLKRAAAAGPRSAAVHRNLGFVLWRHFKRPDAAVPPYREALRHRPNDATIIWELDRIYTELGRHDERRALLPRAPREARLKLRKALLQLHLRQPDQALAILQANRFPPWEGWSEAAIVFDLALHQRIDRQMAAGRHREAIADIKLAMTFPENLGSGRPASPDHSEELVKLGRCQQALGQPAAARYSFEQVVSRKLGNLGSPAIVHRAGALEALGRSAEARELLARARALLEQRAAEIGRASPWALYALGVVCEAQGDRRRAIWAHEKALDKRPHHHRAYIARQRLLRTLGPGK